MRGQSSFLLPCWDLGGPEERIEIEHIQSGTTWLARSLGAAAAWIGAYGEGPARHQGDREEGGVPGNVIRSTAPCDR